MSCSGQSWGPVRFHAGPVPSGQLGLSPPPWRALRPWAMLCPCLDERGGLVNCTDEEALGRGGGGFFRTPQGDVGLALSSLALRASYPPVVQIGTPKLWRPLTVPKVLQAALVLGQRQEETPGLRSPMAGGAEP